MFIKEKIKNWLQIILLTLTTGLLLAFTLPPFEIEAFVWFALIPFLFFLNRKLSRKQFFIGSSLAGFIYILFLLWPLTSLNSWWIINPDLDSFWWTHKESLLKIFIIMASVYCGSLFFVLFGLLHRKFAKNNWQDILILPLFWAILEFLREFFVFGFGWGELGYTLNNNLPIIQIASIIKVYGLSFIIVAVNVTIFLWISNLKQEKLVFNKIVNKFSFLAIFLIILPLIFGYYRINLEKNYQKSLKVSVIHSSIKTQDGANQKSHDLYLETLENALKNNPEIVLFPENTLVWLEIDEKTKLPTNKKSKIVDDIYQKLLNLSKKSPKTDIFIGLHTKKEGSSFNSIVALNNGEIIDIYNKRKVLPIFEDNFVFFNKNHTNPIRKSENQSKIGLETKNVKVAALICSEISLSRLSKTGSGNLIINPSNDSVFDNPIVGKQNQIMAKIRAVENNQFVLRSVKGGKSAIINPFGEILKESFGDKEIQFIEEEINFD